VVLSNASMRVRKQEEKVNRENKTEKQEKHSFFRRKSTNKIDI